jgi:5-formyltetrahydrofolate cyclo-ligase
MVMEESILLYKNQIRKEMSVLRQNLSDYEHAEQSSQVFKKVEQLPFFEKAKVVMAYWSVKDELATHDFIRKWSKEKTIVLPCIEGEQLLPGRFTDETVLRPHHRFKIPEPVGEKINPQEIDLVIVPGLAFDRRNHRLGYGKGFYDRFLSGLSAYKVGVCFRFQMMEELPVNEFDVALDLIVTE